MSTPSPSRVPDSRRRNDTTPQQPLLKTAPAMEKKGAGAGKESEVEPERIFACKGRWYFHGGATAENEEFWHELSGIQHLQLDIGDK